MRKVFLLLLVGVMLLSGCSAVDSISNEIVDQVSNVVQSTDKYVMTIQNANMNGTTYTYKDVFSNFFAYPTWKHFTSDDGQEVVEFTGECTYDNQNVKSLIQFVITNETDDYMEWETTYLSFNNVSQPLIMLSALLEKAIEEYDNIQKSNNTDIVVSNKVIETAMKKLGVPKSEIITYELSEPFSYMECLNCVEITFYENGELVAAGKFNADNGDILVSIIEYGMG